MKFFKDIKTIVILTMVLLFFIEIPQENIRFVLWILTGVFCAGFFDFLIHYLIHRKILIVKSAIISGFIVAGIINFQEPFWIIIIFSLIAVLSKHLIKSHKKHFLNPANTALFIATACNIPLTWSLESNIYIVIIAGIYFIYRLKKWGHILGFLIAFSIPMMIKGINPLLMFNWFFLFIMLIEPKTSGFGLIRGLTFGSIAGLTAFLIFLFIPQYDFFVTSLFIANLCNPVLDKIYSRH